MSEMNMVERVARALCKRCRVIPSCDCGGHFGSLLDDARLAIEAVRGVPLEWDEIRPTALTSPRQEPTDTEPFR